MRGKWQGGDYKHRSSYSLYTTLSQLKHFNVSFFNPSSSWVMYPWFVRHNGILFLNHGLIRYPDKSISFVNSNVKKKIGAVTLTNNLLEKKLKKHFSGKQGFWTSPSRLPRARFSYIYIYILSSLSCEQIWLDPPMDGCQCGYITKVNKST